MKKLIIGSVAVVFLAGSALTVKTLLDQREEARVVEQRHQDDERQERLNEGLAKAEREMRAIVDKP